jgi:hypothetical protein
MGGWGGEGKGEGRMGNGRGQGKGGEGEGAEYAVCVNGGGRRPGIRWAVFQTRQGWQQGVAGGTLLAAHVPPPSLQKASPIQHPPSPTPHLAVVVAAKGVDDAVDLLRLPWQLEGARVGAQTRVKGQRGEVERGRERLKDLPARGWSRAQGGGREVT